MVITMNRILLLALTAGLLLPVSATAELRIEPPLEESVIPNSIRKFSSVLSDHLALAFSLPYSLNRISSIFYDEDEELYKCVNFAKSKIEEGFSFSESLKECPSIFSNKLIETIKKGEENGTLIEVLKGISEGNESGEINSQCI